MLTKLVLCCAFLATAFAYNTNVNVCTANPGDLPLNTYLEGCRDPPCQLPQLQDAVINVLFRAPRPLATLRTLATAYLRIGFITIPVPYDLQEQAETCNFLVDAQCPLAEGQLVRYTLRMHIESFFPVGTSVAVEFRVVDEGDQPVFCIRVPITVAPPAVA